MPPGLIPHWTNPVKTLAQKFTKLVLPHRPPNLELLCGYAEAYRDTTGSNGIPHYRVSARSLGVTWIVLEFKESQLWVGGVLMGADKTEYTEEQIGKIRT